MHDRGAVEHRALVDRASRSANWSLALVGALICRQVALPALRRHRRDVHARTDPSTSRRGRRPAVRRRARRQSRRVPVTLRDVSYRYPGAAVDAIAGVDLTIEPGTFVAIVGDNGSGKSTLASIIAGLDADRAARSSAPGAVGIGKVGGTARVFQRPESQVLGAPVSPTTCGGESPRDAISDDDIDTHLRASGSTGFAMRDTETLSGGELQRLAIASALAAPARAARVRRVDRDARPGRPRDACSTCSLAVARARHDRRARHARTRRSCARADVVVVLDDGRVRAVGPPDEVLASEGTRHRDRSTAASGTCIRARLAVGAPRARRRRPRLRRPANKSSSSARTVRGSRRSRGRSPGCCEPTEGDVRLDGHPIDLARKRDRDLVPARAAAAVPADGRVPTFASAREGRRPGGRRGTRVRRSRTGARSATGKVDELSGGEQRRVALAGAVDAPPAGARARRTARRSRRARPPHARRDAPTRCASSAAMTIISVTHDLGFAQLLGDARGRVAPRARRVRRSGRRRRRGVRQQDPGRRLMATTTDLHLLRCLPWSSPVHRLWAGTKLLITAAHRHRGRRETDLARDRHHRCVRAARRCSRRATRPARCRACRAGS